MKINDILSQESAKRLEIAEIQTKEIEAFERLEKVADGVGSAFETAGKKITDALKDFGK